MKPKPVTLSHPLGNKQVWDTWYDLVLSGGRQGAVASCDAKCPSSSQPIRYSQGLVSLDTPLQLVSHSSSATPRAQELNSKKQDVHKTDGMALSF